MSSRRIVLSSLLASMVVLPLAGCLGSQAPKDATGRPLESLTIITASGSHEFMVEIADEEPERERGLMFREPLAADRGMLFEFPDVAERAFWMRNTPSSLDIIYIDPQGRIVSIASHAVPFSEQPIPSNGAASGVLELRAGRAGEIGAKAGDQVQHVFFHPKD